MTPTRSLPLSLGNELRRARAVANGTMTPAERDADREADGQRILRERIDEAMQFLHISGITVEDYAAFLSGKRADDAREASGGDQ